MLPSRHGVQGRQTRTVLIMILSLALSVLAQVNAPSDSPVKNVVLIVSDGVRAREVFEGGERALMGLGGGVENEEGCVAKFHRPDVAARREVLMPFLWKTVVKQGQLFGLSRVGSPMRVSNRFRVSYPGYNELFTGWADPRIDSNGLGENPNVTVFEHLAKQRGFEGGVQAFATWETFFRIFAVSRSKLDVRAGWNPPFANDPVRTPGKDVIDAIHRGTTPMFGGNALDAMTYAALKESLKTTRPRLLFLGLGETDEWMHAGRYDLALEALQRADATIADLWNTMQSMDEYRGSTVFLITTDHGRGGLPWDWKHHGANVLGAEDIWLAALGPGVPALGVRRDTGLVTQAQVASTIASLLGHDWVAVNPKAAPPLPLRPVTALAAGSR
jgi:hypothetical protein